jgi:hypothetical protein
MGDLTVPRKSRVDRAVYWIEHFCRYPHGPDRGQSVVLTPEQRAIVRQIYDSPDGTQPDLSGPLAAYLALFSVCGPRSLQRNFGPQLKADIFTLWSASGPELRAVLRRDGERIVCPELGTSYPAAA